MNTRINHDLFYLYCKIVTYKLKWKTIRIVSGGKSYGSYCFIIVKVQSPGCISVHTPKLILSWSIFRFYHNIQSFGVRVNQCGTSSSLHKLCNSVTLSSWHLLCTALFRSPHRSPIGFRSGLQNLHLVLVKPFLCWFFNYFSLIANSAVIYRKHWHQ